MLQSNFRSAKSPSISDPLREGVKSPSSSFLDPFARDNPGYWMGKSELSFPEIVFCHRNRVVVSEEEEDKTIIDIREGFFSQTWELFDFIDMFINFCYLLGVQ